MKIVWSKTADKQFSKIDTRYKSRIKSRLEKMDDKASPISDIKKLSSPENHYRLRLGDYRVIYTFGDPPGDTCYVENHHHIVIEYFGDLHIDPRNKKT